MNYTFNFLLDRKLILAFATSAGLSAAVSFFYDNVSYSNHLKKVSTLLSKPILEKDDLSIQIILDTLSTTTKRRIKLITYDNREILTSKIESKICSFRQQNDISFLGQKIASINSCRNLSELSSAIFASETFLLLFSIIQLFGIFYLTASKSSLEKNLISLIKSLEQEKYNFTNYIGSDSPLFLKIEDLIVTRENARKELVDSKSALERNIALANMAKQVAHDMRSPLSSINLAVSKLDEKEDPRIKLIVASSDRLTGIANELLSKSRIENQHQIANFGQAIEDIITEFSNTRNASFRLQGDFQLSTICPVINIQRLFANLFQNSIDASTSNPEISLSISKIDGFRMVVVEDKGSGFHSLVLESAGDKNISLGKKHGTGIGLGWCKQLMRNIKGDLQIENTSTGARVSLLFPDSVLF